MKKLWRIVILLCWINVQAQTTDVCFVTSVKGRASIEGKQLRIGEKLSYSMAQTSLTIDGPRDFVTFFSPTRGSFKVSRQGLTQSKNPGHNLIHFAEELLRIHERKVPLSSRGDCDCVLPSECLSTDPKINERLLLLDSIAFPSHTLLSADSGFYFLQSKVNGKLMNKPLKSANGFTFITKNDIVKMNEDGQANDEMDYILGLCRFIGGEKKLSLVTTVRFAPINAIELKEHFQTLKNTMPDAEPQKIFETFCSDIYVYYGKPNLCTLRQLVNHQDK